MQPQIILITGASSGFGKITAQMLSEQGHIVYGTSRKPSENIGKVRMLVVDVTNSISVRQAVEQIISEQGRMDVLINNAGISHIGLLSDMSVSQWRRVMSTNLDSCFYTCRRAIPLMVHAKQGRIINISSVWGQAGASMEAAYSASKGGVNSLTKALAKELAPSNIQVNAIACGAIDTDMNAFLSEDERASLIEEIPAGRLGTPAEVGSLVQSLCSDSGYLTGQVIQLDGGWI